MMTKSKVARLWEGTVRVEDADAYHAYLEETGLGDYAATPGCAGGCVLRRDDAGRGRVTFLLVTFWASMDAIRAFAGEDVERARYYPEDERYLLEMSETVDHYEVARVLGPGPDAG